MARPKQAIINDLMGELDKFGGHITNIRDAIQSKGVTSEGKLFKFAEEINSIEPASTYGYILDAVKGAYSKGYSDSEIVGIINNLADKNQPPQPQPQPGPNPVPTFDAATATEILPKQFYGRSDLEGELTCPNVVKVGALAFVGTDHNIINLPKATDIDRDAFANSSLAVINIPAFVWADDNLDLKSYDLIRVNKITVSEESRPPRNVMMQKISLEVYNPDHSKKWNLYNEEWEKTEA